MAEAKAKAEAEAKAAAEKVAAEKAAADAKVLILTRDYFAICVFFLVTIKIFPLNLEFVLLSQIILLATFMKHANSIVAKRPLPVNIRHCMVNRLPWSNSGQPRWQGKRVSQPFDGSCG